MEFAREAVSRAIRPLLLEQGRWTFAGPLFFPKGIFLTEM
jgi:hypothetical protein